MKPMVDKIKQSKKNQQWAKKCQQSKNAIQKPKKSDSIIPNSNTLVNAIH